MNFIKSLSFSILEEHLKQRAKINNPPRELKMNLSKYENTIDLLNISEYQQRSGSCHECGKHRNNKTRVRFHECHVFVCKKHSVCKTTCYDCNTAENESDH